MRSRSIRLKPIHVVLAFALLALFALAVSAAAPAPAPVEGNMPKPQAGAVAPQFSLVDQNGKTQKLSDYKGKWVVVYFYPKDQTPGCTSQACSFTENVFAFRKANAQILGISVDDVASHKEFEKALSGAASDKLNDASKAAIAKLSEQTKKDIAEHGLPFPLLADSTFATSKAYGVMTARGTTSRETFLIAPDGKVAKHYDVTREKLDGHSAELLADIEAFKNAEIEAKVNKPGPVRQDLLKK
jgi:peroxiredoxin Q/BCP